MNRQGQSMLFFASRELAEIVARPHTSAAPSCQALKAMLNSPKVLGLRESLARASMTPSTSSYGVTDKTLHDEICAVVDELKAAGWPPERAIIAIKEIAFEAGLTQSQGVLVRDRDLAPRDALLAKLVRWTIECYYDTTRVA